MAFSEELKNNVIDIDTYDQSVSDRIDELLNKYIKGNDTFIDDYYVSTGIDGEDISKYPFEEKLAVAKQNFKISDHDNGTNFSADFEKRYEEYVKGQEIGKKEVIEILDAIQKRFAQRINTVNKKLNEASRELSEQEKQIKEKEDQIRDENVKIITLKQEIEKLNKELEELNDKITDLYNEKDELEEKDKLSPEEEKRLEEIKKELDPMVKEYEDKEKIRDEKVADKKLSEDNVSNLKKEKEGLEKEHADSKEIYNEAKESVEKAREAYIKNGEEIQKVAKENNIDIDGILNLDEKDEKDNSKEEKETKKDTKDGKSVAGGSGVASVPVQEQDSNIPTNHVPDHMNNFSECSNPQDRMNMYINNPEGFKALSNAIQNRGMFDFWKNHRVKRAIGDNNKMLLANMKDPADYISLVNSALGSDSFSKNEQDLFERLFDKKSKENILGGFSKYSNQDMESLYNVINKLNSKDFSANPELAKKINSEIMPYIKIGVLTDYSKRKPLGRFNSKHEMTGKNQYINYISNEATNYSAKLVQSDINLKNNPFIDPKLVVETPVVDTPTMPEPRKPEPKSR